MRLSIIYFLAIMCFSLMITSCGNHHKDSRHMAINDYLESISADSFEMPADTRDLLGDVELIKDADHDFYVPEQKSGLNSFPCANCHIVGLETVKADESGQKAHWDISLSHAKDNIMNCQTCHNNENMNKLVSINNEQIDFNFSYNQCAQCHSTQHKDWLGGAHGKNLGGWVEPRVMNSCVDCHNPHKPAFESRWPARLNTIKLQEQNSN